MTKQKYEPSLCLTCQRCLRTEISCDHTPISDGNKTIWDKRHKSYYVDETCPVAPPYLLIFKAIKECHYYQAKENIPLVLALERKMDRRQEARLDFRAAIEAPTALLSAQCEPARKILTEKLTRLHKEQEKARAEYGEAIAPFTEEYKRAERLAKLKLRATRKDDKAIIEAELQNIKRKTSKLRKHKGYAEAITQMDFFEGGKIRADKGGDK